MKQFTPKNGDIYYTYFGFTWGVTWEIWIDTPADYARLKSGIVFQTEEEAIKKQPLEFARIQNTIKEKPATYYTITDIDWRISKENWNEDVLDYIRAYTNNIFTTHKEAEQNKKNIQKYLKGE